MYSFKNLTKEYDQFLKDVKEQGIDIVEGEDVVTVVTEDYAVARRKAYGPIEDQLNKIYHFQKLKDKIHQSLNLNNLITIFSLINYYYIICYKFLQKYLHKK